MKSLPRHLNHYCCGFWGMPRNQRYVVGLTLGVGVVPCALSHRGSDCLDDICAFDKAEVDDVYLGQINMITVSSFCGPQGDIYGYDIDRVKQLKIPHPLIQKPIRFHNQTITPFNGAPLIGALRSLFGTLDTPNHHLLPGSMVPCAGKSITRQGPLTLYAGFALGIPQDRKRHACLFMEDVGIIPLSPNRELQLNAYKSDVLTLFVQSVLQIGENQHIRYTEIFVEVKTIVVEHDQMGCALVAAPYFTLPPSCKRPRNKRHIARRRVKGS